MSSGTLHGENGILATEPPEKSQSAVFFFSCSFVIQGWIVNSLKLASREDSEDILSSQDNNSRVFIHCKESTVARGDGVYLKRGQQPESNKDVKR